MNEKRVHLDQVLFEFIPRGRYVKVSAVDPVTGTEISIVGDAQASAETLKRIATQKLEFVLTKRLAGDDN
jgi:hypothetical protein